MKFENDILIVDDEILNLRLLTELLEKEGYRVRPAEKTQTALDSALAKPPGLILLDVRMPEMDGFELCRRLKQDKRTKHVPVIFVSALQDLEARINGFEAGGVDFITKPFQEEEILARVRTHMSLHRFQQHLKQLVDERTFKLSESSASLERKVREFQESEERFRNLMEQSPMPIEILSLDGKILQSNPSWRKLWGVDEVGAAETMEKYNMLTDPQLKKLGIKHLVKKAFSGEPTILPPIIYDANEAAEDFEIENLIGLKSPWIQCHLYPIKDENGKVVNIINTYIDISDLKNAEVDLRNAYEEIKSLKEQLEAESAYLQDEIKLEHNFKNIIGQSESLKYVLHRVEQVAPTDSPVLIMGETGTGKELMARALHELSPHGRRALVKVNCAALPRELIESELFGREKGAYTGAATAQAGRFELAKGSTLFLDEIGELPLELQAKLLRVLESGEFERLGSPRTLRSDARIIAATNRVLEEEVRKGRFREDLWYRLKVFPITVPPLREHPEDIPLLVKWFVDLLARKMGKGIAEIPKRTIQILQNYPWPGNVRELKHAVEAAMITAQGKMLNFDLPKVADTEPTDFESFEEMERDYILRVLKARNWRIGGANSAASTLGMHVNTLRGRMKKLGIKRPKS
jgi:formate hydrogenlyase transcriptional activator